VRTIEHGDARAISLRRAVRPRGRPTLEGLREAAAGCTGCHLYQRATQTVFGDGDARARVMLVGEQPGNDEDLAGRHRSTPRLRHQRGEALQVGATRQAADSRQAERGRDRRLPAVARRRDRPDPAHGSRLPRRDGCPGSPRAAVSCHPGARTVRPVAARAIRSGDRASLGAAPRARRRDAAP
jgi:hypothetical protein